jgi:hypothetical protein
MSEAKPNFIVEVGKNERHQRKALYVCQCGKEFVALEYNIQSGHTKSCGCQKSPRLSIARTTHNESRPQTTEYRTWASMKKRCVNPKDKNYPRYGARGIRVHKEWIDSYEAFLAHVGRKPTPMHTLDRIENSGNYEPGNVQWATKMQQARNRRSNFVIEFQGKSQCLEAWAKDIGISAATLKERLQKWPLDRAIKQPSMRVI